MMAEMPERLFQEWHAFYELSPFGDDWRQTARICMVIQNMMRQKGKACKEEDFLPFKPKPVAEPDKVRAGLLGWLMPMVRKQPQG